MIETVVAESIAKCKGHRYEKRWIAAIKKAAIIIGQGGVIRHKDGWAVKSQSANVTYLVRNGEPCACFAGKMGKPCAHKAAVRLMERMREKAQAEVDELFT